MPATPEQLAAVLCEPEMLTGMMSMTAAVLLHRQGDDGRELCARLENAARNNDQPGFVSAWQSVLDLTKRDMADEATESRFAAYLSLKFTPEQRDAIAAGIA